EIYLMNADGSNLRRMTDHPGGDASPAWSPDGEYIIFTSNRSGNFEIHVMKRDGTGLTRITNDAATDNWPSWKP
ncbi:MAG: PD40 domain-containing protein, partial [Gemmatimonadales bacterium]|nr:PD40 domain-containing protein [Gemmatimonadales bacterium]